MSFIRSSTRTLFPRRPYNGRLSLRSLSTLPGNDHVYIHPTGTTYTLSLLPTTPVNPTTALGTCTSASSLSGFQENPAFYPVLQATMAAHAAADPYVQQEAIAFASQSGVSIDRAAHTRRGAKRAEKPGGWIHVCDLRNTPAFGRIAEPQDIFGSLMVDGQGNVLQGSYSPNNTYRLRTEQEGVMRLSEYLHGKLVEALKAI
ncbi:hypothetical protein EDC01DRAFT_264154 [Geopyxis carbonaria]|nr:hypothetical protein EDC01DRAFT_264154 [Geopyxis carbonaria]